MSPSASRTEKVDSKMDDMTQFIKNLSAKISRLEMENGNQNKPIQDNDNKNPNQFRRTFNPQILNRERINEDIPIHALVRPNEAIIYVPPDEEYIGLLEGMNLLCDDNQMIHLTENKYEAFLLE